MNKTAATTVFVLSALAASDAYAHQTMNTIAQPLGIVTAQSPRYNPKVCKAVQRSATNKRTINYRYKDANNNFRLLCEIARNPNTNLLDAMCLYDGGPMGPDGKADKKYQGSGLTPKSLIGGIIKGLFSLTPQEMPAAQADYKRLKKDTQYKAGKTPATVSKFSTRPKCTRVTLRPKRP